MKANELMIGDWVLDTRTDTPLRVNPFMAEMEVPEWQPILLTPEILEKNGFEVDPSNTRMLFHHDNYRLCYYFNSGKHFSSFNITNGSLAQKVIVNVHELQHALKFCGIDKEIII
jgi:hypothetical protein